MRESEINAVPCVVLANELRFCIASFASDGEGSSMDDADKEH